MARRIAWTNNSSGHDGTTIHRSTATMDPQALPAPLATVAAGTTEYVDGETLADGTYYYRVQDYQGASVSAASDEQSFVISSGLDYSAAQVGDEIGGGIYAGTITYGDGRQFHIVFAKQSGELAPGASNAWKTERSATPGADDLDDGAANTSAMESESLVLHEAAAYCLGYSDGAYSDWYLPAKNEMALAAGLVADAHPEFSTDPGTDRWTSTETAASSTKAWTRNWNGDEYEYLKDYTSFMAIRPIRRVPV